MTTYTTHTDTPATVAYRKVASQVARLIPSDFPSDDRYWRPMFDAYDRFADAVRACETHDSEASRQRVRVAATAWRASCHRAVADWRDERMFHALMSLVRS